MSLNRSYVFADDANRYGEGIFCVRPTECHQSEHRAEVLERIARGARRVHRSVSLRPNRDIELHALEMRRFDDSTIVEVAVDLALRIRSGLLCLDAAGWPLEAQKEGEDSGCHKVSITCEAISL